MQKGLAPVVKTMTTVLGIMFVLFLIVVFAFKASLLTSNPCWSKVLKGLAPLEGRIRAQANLELDSQCVSKIVFTGDSNVCKLTCNQYGTEKTSACINACDDSRAGTFIIALPRKIDKFKEAWAHRDIRYLRDSEPAVFTLKCDFQGLQDGIETCEKNPSMGSWECNPGNGGETFSRTYPLYVKASPEGKTCRIVYSESTGSGG